LLSDTSSKEGYKECQSVPTGRYNVFWKNNMFKAKAETTGVYASKTKQIINPYNSESSKKPTETK